MGASMGHPEVAAACTVDSTVQAVLFASVPFLYIRKSTLANVATLSPLFAVDVTVDVTMDKACIYGPLW
jgi:hypothetical protein